MLGGPGSPAPLAAVHGRRGPPLGTSDGLYTLVINNTLVSNIMTIDVLLYHKQGYKIKIQLLVTCMHPIGYG